MFAVFRPIRLLSTTAGFAFAVAGVSSGIAAETAVAEAPKDHLLFIGLDITLPGQGGPGLVQDVSRGQARIAVNGETQKVYLRGLRDVGLSPEPKVSGVILQMSEPVGRATFTPGQNPARTILEQQTNVAFVQDARMAAAESAVFQLAVPPTVSQLDAQRLSGATGEAAQQMDATITATMGESFDPGSVQQRSERAMGDGVHDAYDVTFTLAAPGPIADAYAVMILDVLSAGSPHKPTQSVLFRELPTITTEPRKVTLEQRGLPEGFLVDQVRIHIYRHGRELGTTRSERSVALSRAEAHQFLVLQYQLAHKKESRPPALMPEFLPAPFAEILPANARGRPVAVKVTRDGTVEGVQLRGELPADLAAHVTELIRTTLFYPALRNGEPAASDGTFLLREFLPGPEVDAPLPLAATSLN